MMWTEEEDKQLIDMWQNGAVGPVIAKVMGKTRGAIMGRISRLRQAGTVMQERPRVKSENNRDERRKKDRERKRLQAMARKPQPKVLLKAAVLRALEIPVVKEAPMTADDVPYQNPCEIMDLRFFSCRYIVGEKPTLYCNNIIHKHSYCEHHFKLCYQVGTNVPLAAKPRPAYRNS